MLHLVFVWLTAFTAVQCSSVGGQSDLSTVSYRLERTATNKAINYLYIALSKEDGYSFSIEGSGFSASVPIGQQIAIVPSIELTYQQETTYSLVLKVFQSDGTILAQDTLTWIYSTEVPSKPIISILEEATNDTAVDVYSALNRGEHTKELWVDGDVQKPDWLPIRLDSSAAVTLTESDGIKTLFVRYRNIFGTESVETVSISILKKSVPPTNCSVSTNSTTSADGTVRLQLSATNNGPLYFLVEGDVQGDGKYKSFTDQHVETLTLTGGETNEFQVKLRDIAGNFCPDKTFQVTVDPTHLAEGIEVTDHALWTDNPIINVTPLLDHVSSDVAEMYIHGNVQPDSKTFQWIPFENSVDVQLTPVDGHRFVRAKYRLNGVESVVRSAGVYLQPFIRVTGSSAPYAVELSDIVGLTSLTLTGCSETYNNVAFQSPLACTPVGLSLQADYYLTDGTSVRRTTDSP